MSRTGVSITQLLLYGTPTKGSGLDTEELKWLVYTSRYDSNCTRLSNQVCNTLGCMNNNDLGVSKVAVGDTKSRNKRRLAYSEGR